MLRRLHRQIDDFWPYYVSQHANPTNRRLHFAGNTYLFGGLAVAVWQRSPALFAFVILSAYAIAWVGHFVFERNIPATLRYPVLAGLCDMRMYLKTWRGEMDAEVTKHGARVPER